jgi:hypothetical protein
MHIMVTLTIGGGLFNVTLCVFQLYLERLTYFWHISSVTWSVPDHDGGRPMEVNACILITHMVYL